MNSFNSLFILALLSVVSTVNACVNNHDCSDHGKCILNKCVCDSGYYTTTYSTRECNRLSTKPVEVLETLPRNAASKANETFFFMLALIFGLVMIMYVVVTIYTFSIIFILLLWCFGFITNDKMIKLVKIYIVVVIFFYLLGLFV